MSRAKPTWSLPWRSRHSSINGMKFDVGFSDVSPPIEETSTNVILIHDVTEGRDKSWSKQDTEDNGWCKLLSEAIPEARIMAFGYDASTMTELSHLLSPRNLEQHAEDFLNGLRLKLEVLDRQTPGDGSSSGDMSGGTRRPLIIVAHGYGGLVYEHALVKSPPGGNFLAERSQLVFLLGTPHYGAGIGEWAIMCAKRRGIRCANNAQSQKWTDDLRNSVASITEQQKKLRGMLSTKDPGGPVIKIAGCFASMPNADSKPMMSPEWAAMPEFTPISLQTDHFGMPSLDPKGRSAQTIATFIRTWNDPAMVREPGHPFAKSEKSTAHHEHGSMDEEHGQAERNRQEAERLNLEQGGNEEDLGADSPVAQGPSNIDSQKRLCLLSLDGVGVRGLSSLMILKRLMEELDPEADTPPKPCEYFDMIGGTSAGGLIAIMLGRLRMSVDECIAHYIELSTNVFTKRHHRFDVTRHTRGRFDQEALKKAIKMILRSQNLKEEELLKETDRNACKTFVCATSKFTSETVVLSNYYSGRRGIDLRNVMQIWEAGCATSAATTLFEPIAIGGEYFVDGATGANNPINELWTEANDVWDDGPAWRLEDHIKCLVSIGAGKLSFSSSGTWSPQVVEALQGIATETEKTADDFHKRHSELFSDGKAFRFNVDQGLELVGPEEADKINEIQAVTNRYMEIEQVRLWQQQVVVKLRESQCILTSSDSLGGLER